MGIHQSTGQKYFKVKDKLKLERGGTTNGEDSFNFLRNNYNLKTIGDMIDYFEKYKNCNDGPTYCMKQLRKDLHDHGSPSDKQYHEWVDKLCSNKYLLDNLIKRLTKYGALKSGQIFSDDIYTEIRKRAIEKQRQMRRQRRSNAKRAKTNSVKTPSMFSKILSKFSRSRKFGYSHNMGPKLYDASMNDGILLANNAFTWQANPLARALNAGSG